LPVGGGPRVAFVEQEHDGALPGRVREKAKRRRVDGVENAKVPRQAGEWAQGDGEPCRTGASGAIKLVAERGIGAPWRSDSRSDRSEFSECALGRGVEGFGQPPANGRPDVLETHHEQARLLEVEANPGTLVGRNEANFADVPRQGARGSFLVSNRRARFGVNR
jgi:hypothetical protein